MRKFKFKYLWKLYKVEKLINVKMSLEDEGK